MYNSKTLLGTIFSAQCVFKDLNTSSTTAGTVCACRANDA